VKFWSLRLEFESVSFPLFHSLLLLLHFVNQNLIFFLLPQDLEW